MKERFRPLGNSFITRVSGAVLKSGDAGPKIQVGSWAQGGEHWLNAAGESGISCAFVVSKKGKIAYIGHPMELKKSLRVSLLAESSTTAPQVPAADAAPSAKALEISARAQTQIQAGKLDEAESTLGELLGALNPLSPRAFPALGGDRMILGGLVVLGWCGLPAWVWLGRKKPVVAVAEESVP